MNYEFLPISAEECRERGWDAPDFVYVSGDAYVDHPSFGPSIISRVLENAGYRVAMLAQPDYKSCQDFKRFGKPRLGFLVSSGNIDSMVAHYTVSKKKRNYDYYSPGGKMGLRPDRAVIVYSNRIREAYGDVPIILGGLEASLRRFAHYDYWDDKVRHSILVDSRADILTYGQGEKILLRLAELLARGIPVKKIHDVRGTVYLTSRDDKIHYEHIDGYSYDDLKTDKTLYAKAFAMQYENNDAISGRAITEYYDNKMLVQNPPMPPLERDELDLVYSLPYARRPHPVYDKDGGVPGIAEVQFSITHNRGCFGACNFCAITYNQGRAVRSRSIESCVEEAKKIAALPEFKGYIHDVGGPTADFRHPACEKQLKLGVCTNRKCLAPKPCPNLKVDHSDYVKLLRAIEAVPGVKKVFIRSGIRFDYVVYDKNEEFFKKLVRDHVSGQLKVAPEHCCDGVLSAMGKPSIEVYNKFKDRYFQLTKSIGKEQYLVPYLMSSHPGSTLSDAVELALYLKKSRLNPEQVQDFYPTPGTASTVMFYTGLDPFTMKKVYVASSYEEKKLQRALLQFNRPENAESVREALRRAGREDLIGYGEGCLVRPSGKPAYIKCDKKSSGKNNAKRKDGGKSKSNGQRSTEKGKETNSRTARTSAQSKTKSTASISPRVDVKSNLKRSDQRTAKKPKKKK